MSSSLWFFQLSRSRAWVRATEETLGNLPGIMSASLHKSKDGTRVVNYAQWKTSENWERLLEIGKSSYFVEMGKFGKPDAHHYEVCYQIDKTNDQVSSRNQNASAAILRSNYILRDVL